VREPREFRSTRQHARLSPFWDERARSTHACHKPIDVPRVPWADAIAQAWSRGLGDVPQRAFVIDTLASSLQPRTSRSYGSKWDAFQAWCTAQADSPSAVPAMTVTVLRYLADVGVRATVAASSLQPYLTAINAVYRDLILEPPALGPAASRIANSPLGVRLSASRCLRQWSVASSTGHWPSTSQRAMRDRPRSSVPASP
jgi:hypothetical protein